MTSDDDQPTPPPTNDRPSDMPSGGASDAPAEQSGEGSPEGATAVPGDAPRKRRRRRRRKGPHPEGAPGEAVASGEAGETHAETESTLHLPEGAAPALSAPTLSGSGEALPAGEQPKRKRRRRRRKPSSEGAAVPVLDENGQPIVTVSAEGAPGVEGARAPRPPRSRRPRREGAAATGDATSGTGESAPRQVMGPFLPRAHRPRRDGAPAGERPPRERTPRGDRPPRDRAAAGDRPPRERAAAGDRPPRERGPGGDRGPRDRDRRPGGGGGGKFGKGGGRGDARSDRPAPKLYTMESVVDRGFDEVPDTENEGATKREAWSIVKRTVADQRAAKTVSALYVLKRDSGDTEFGNLAAARAAVNKTIVHPEKLTKAKGDYASTKK
jgi:hypothetical protein